MSNDNVHDRENILGKLSPKATVTGVLAWFVSSGGRSRARSGHWAEMPNCRRAEYGEVVSEQLLRTREPRCRPAGCEWARRWRRSTALVAASG